MENMSGIQSLSNSMQPWIILEVVEMTWPALLMSIVLMFLSYRNAPKKRWPRTQSLLGMYLGPLIMLCIGTLMYGRLQNYAANVWLNLLIYGMGVSSLLPLIYFCVREWKTAQRWLLLLHTLSTLLVTIVTWFVSIMAMTNDWL